MVNYPEGMSGFIQSSSPDWIKNKPLCDLRASVVNHSFSQCPLCLCGETYLFGGKVNEYKKRTTFRA
jgi:hypothetical protein